MSDEARGKRQWISMSCGACNVMSDFFTSYSHSQRLSSAASIHSSYRMSLAGGPWRQAVLKLLESRDVKEIMYFCDYEQAVDKVRFDMF